MKQTIDDVRKLIAETRRELAVARRTLRRLKPLPENVQRRLEAKLAAKRCKALLERYYFDYVKVDYDEITEDDRECEAQAQHRTYAAIPGAAQNEANP